MKLFELFATLTLDVKDFEKGISDSSKTVDSFEKSLKKTSKRSGDMMTSVQKTVSAKAVAFGTIIANAAEKAASSVVSVSKKAFSVSGELEQNVGGSEAVFENWSKKVQYVAKRAYKSVGLSMSDYLAEANKMGSLLKGMGYETDEAFKITTSVMQRASDVASIMGIDISMAMQSVEGAAKGNFTMMDNLGVPINDLTLANYALEKGIEKSTKQMTTQEKVALAFQMFMEKTTDYAGNYAKENDTLVGSMTSLSAAFDNLLTGQISEDDFSEMLTVALDVAVDRAAEIFPRLVESAVTVVSELWPRLKELFTEWAPEIEEAGADIIASLYNGLTGSSITKEDVEEAIGDVFDIASYVGGNVTSFIEDMFSWILDHKETVVGAIIAIAVAFETFKLTTNPVGAAIDLIVAGLGLIIANWEGVKNAVKSAIKAMREFLGLDNPIAETGQFGGVVAWEAVNEWTDSMLTGDSEAIQKAWGKAQAALGGSELAADFSRAYDSYIEQNGLEYGARAPVEWFEGTDVKLAEELDDMDLVAQPSAEWSGDTQQDLQQSLNGMSLSVPVSAELSGINAAYGDAAASVDKLRNDILATIPGHASGLDYVPYDNYIARLHHGETVLTKTEASAWRADRNSGIDVVALGEAIASAVGDRPVAINIDGKAFATIMSRQMSKAIGNRNIQQLMSMGG